MALPTSRIPTLLAVVLPLTGNELFETVQAGATRQVNSRAFVLPTDSLLTVSGMGGSLPGSRQLTAGIGITFTDGGPASTFQINATGAVAGPANPTATIGLTAVNGVAVTYMRSDAAPPLSQAINPVWTAQHTFSLDGATNAAIFVSSVRPQLDFNETDGAANNRRWRFEVQTEQFRGRIVDDANAVNANWLTVDRTLNLVDVIDLLAVSVRVNGVAISTSVGANPSASVGLAAVNGVATTFLRSDAAPALSQAITPTWTGTHTFSDTATSQIVVSHSGGALNAKNTLLRSNAGGNFRIASATDAAPSTQVNTAINFERTGIAFTSIGFGNSTDNPAFVFNGTGAMSISGTVTFFKVATTGLDGAILVSSAVPIIGLNDSDGTANNRLWSINCNSEAFAIQARDDAGAGAISAISIDRTGTTIDSIALTAISVTHSGTASFTGAGIFGAVTSNGTLSSIVLTSASPGIIFRESDAAANNQYWPVYVDGATIRFAVSNDAGNTLVEWLNVTRVLNVTTANFANGVVNYAGNEIGWRNIPSLSFATNSGIVDSFRGNILQYTGTGHTLTIDNTLGVNGVFQVINEGTGVLVIAQSGVTITWLNGSGALATGNRNLAIGGTATIYKLSSGQYKIWGTGLT